MQLKDLVYVHVFVHAFFMELIILIEKTIPIYLQIYSVENLQFYFHCVTQVASIVAGLLFFSGWWMAIDASTSDYINTKDVFHLCGVFRDDDMYQPKRRGCY